MRYYWGGSVPLAHGWPFYRLRLDADGIALTPPKLMPFKFKIDVAWDEVARIERKRAGFRLVFKDHRQNVAVGKIRAGRLLATVAQCPVVYNTQMHPTRWSEI